jgi:hypothetical protein
LLPLSHVSATDPRLLLLGAVVAAVMAAAVGGTVVAAEGGTVVAVGVAVAEATQGVGVGGSRTPGRRSQQQQQQGVGARGPQGLVWRGGMGAGGVVGGLAGG